ncbi:MAG: hypothetical protein KatS3mg087_0038 [Patescibacteria group bacterium]|nr:MAG: hypothetical protein KatS3mg087_0038 [Patescibacteria group bacterium]
MSGDYSINEVVLKPVEGSAPDWYDPNDYRKYVLLILRNGKSGIVEVDKLRSLDLANKSPEERDRILSEFLDKHSSGSEKLVEKRSSDKGKVSSRQDVYDESDGEEELDLQELQELLMTATEKSSVVTEKPTAPSVRVDIRFDQVPSTITTYYHDVIVGEGMIVLVYDNRAVGYMIWRPDPESIVYFTIPSLSMSSIKAKATKFSFQHGFFEFNIFEII